MNKYFSSIIIGNGDVVQKRVIPEINRCGDSINGIFDIKETDESNKNLIIFKDINDFLQIINKMNLNNKFIWISTPPDSHINYLQQLLKINSNSLIIIEKPIAVTQDDIKNIKKINLNKQYRNKIFYLSYYLLEKALPLFYYVNHNEAYLKYLKISNKNILNINLGNIKNINIKIIEGIDNRKWANKNNNQFYETMIHNVLIASLFVGTPDKWSNICIKSFNNKNIMHANFKDININLTQEKFSKKSTRFAEIEYDYGKILINFNTQKLIIEKNNNIIGSISIKNNFLHKYSIQYDLIKRVFNKELKSKDVDGLYNQIEYISWLNNNKYFKYQQ